MNRIVFLSFILIFIIFPGISAQDRAQGQHPYVIRGEVYVDFEPIYAGHIDAEYPLDITTASRRALEEAAMFFSGMIYGWTFNYEIGERARQISENIEMVPIDEIKFGDPALKATDTQVDEKRMRLWTDYHLNDAQQRRIQVWRTGNIMNAQAVGYGPVSVEENPGWLAPKKAALEDAARAALRSMLRGSERNRPKEVTGFISLASFPRYYIESGRWAASARFRVQVEEVIPFAAY